MTRFQKLLDLLLGLGNDPKQESPKQYTFLCPTHGEFTKQFPNFTQRHDCGKLSKMKWINNQ